MAASGSHSQVNVHDAKTNFSKLLARVEAGEEIVIAKAGRPVAKLVRVERPNLMNAFGALKGKYPATDDSIWFGPEAEALDREIWADSDLYDALFDDEDADGNGDGDGR
jgi:prevent-host-death family protein